MAEAQRFNEGKPEVSELFKFGPALDNLLAVMSQGAIKYEKDNWLKGGKPVEEYIDAGLRHVRAFLDGEIYDKDTGCHHLAHAVWNFNAAQTLNYAYLPPLDPEFDQAAFLQEYSPAEEVPGVTRAFTKEELRHLPIGTSVRNAYLASQGIVTQTDRDPNCGRLVVLVRKSNGSSLWWKEEDGVWLA